jgi:hypothetical protein
MRKHRLGAKMTYRALVFNGHTSSQQLPPLPWIWRDVVFVVCKRADFRPGESYRRPELRQ